MKVAKLQVVSNQQVSHRYWHMIVDASGLQEDVEPGQFFNIRCADESYPLLRRPFSIYKINPRQQTIEFLYLVKGIGTQRLSQFKSGDTVDVFGPLGVGFTLKENGGKILMLARGVGVATLAALAQKASERQMGSIAVISARTKDDLLAAESLQSCGTEVYTVTEEDGNSDVPHVRQLLEQIFREHDIQAAYTCGSQRLSMLMQEMTKERGIFAEVALEENMGCAMGVCYACVCDIHESDGSIHTVRICREGPVFSLGKVVLT
ncbi:MULTISPECIES: dihydroorotate dehydrogenase electron transfer subunit [unclassified Paenibacillus]|uniref:dihydroorotate dehydrogenase electron transfer subunit n=1 Tax=unclassified Paenibacillus TaxID=185978 RepID=UPI001B7C3E07|nr:MULTISPECIES: dihydroorotate dehydrogenase electron transfer subunit [unclassified Paenibacillus]MBP1154494.1 dihydroorotate dehydrogenase electron transfer subunit [Paenibacillus sp. PvP091]MBP1170122.1 dihydroorotate dehydrogenase electron transfer subunit [Paenibacillus sp. PvR098]MBP2441150.1 dihydroorotate dehydrogenase electron transfer subunit [Paenibacillus sp. PvP052]